MAMSDKIKKHSLKAGEAESIVRIIDADVVTDSPLSIRITKNNKLILPEENFIIPESLTDHTVQVQTPRGTETHTILNALKVGDELTVASIQGGGSYYILGRKAK